MRNYEKHGFSGSSEYQTWKSMKARCCNLNDLNHKDYGARGITVCQRWRDSFMAFYEDMGPRPNGMTLERINNDGNYEPGNCKWVTWKKQLRNTRRNRILEFNGKRQCLTELAEQFGICKYVLRSRLYLGWSIERALTQKIQRKTRKT